MSRNSEPSFKEILEIVAICAGIVVSMITIFVIIKGCRNSRITQDPTIIEVTNHQILEIIKTQADINKQQLELIDKMRVDVLANMKNDEGDNKMKVQQNVNNANRELEEPLNYEGTKSLVNEWFSGEFNQSIKMQVTRMASNDQREIMNQSNEKFDNNIKLMIDKELPNIVNEEYIDTLTESGKSDKAIEKLMETINEKTREINEFEIVNNNLAKRIDTLTNEKSNESANSKKLDEEINELIKTQERNEKDKTSARNEQIKANTDLEKEKQKNDELKEKQKNTDLIKK